MGEKRIISTEIEYSELSESEKFTEEEQIDQCCEEVSVDECADVGKVSPYTSADQEDWDFDPDKITAQYKKTYGEKFLGVELVAVGPEGNCGEKHETWEGRLDCCDEVDEIEYDWDGSVGVLSPDTSGIVRFTGGRLPALVKVRGNGFSLDGYNTREAWTYNRSFRVYAHDMACGTCPITIDDGCTVASGSLRSTLGEWATVDYDAACPGQTEADYAESGWAYIERGGYRWRQRVARFTDVYAYTACSEYGSVDECPADADSYNHGQDYCGAHTDTDGGRLYESWGVNGCISIPANDIYPSTSPCSSASMPATFNSSGCPEGTKRCGTAMYFKGYEKIEKLEWIC